MDVFGKQETCRPCRHSKQTTSKGKDHQPIGCPRHKSRSKSQEKKCDDLVIAKFGLCFLGWTISSYVSTFNIIQKVNRHNCCDFRSFVFWLMRRIFCREIDTIAVFHAHKIGESQEWWIHFVWMKQGSQVSWEAHLSADVCFVQIAVPEFANHPKLQTTELLNRRYFRSYAQIWSHWVFMVCWRKIRSHSTDVSEWTCLQNELYRVVHGQSAHRTPSFTAGPPAIRPLFVWIASLSVNIDQNLWSLLVVKK